MSYLKLILRAEKQELNINRVYEIYLNKGLFDSWVVITAFGRYGSGSQQKVSSFILLEEAKEFISKILKKGLMQRRELAAITKLVKDPQVLILMK